MAREQAWVDTPAGDQRLIVLSANPISQALAGLAGVVGVSVHLIETDEDGQGRSAISDLDPGPADAVLVCDHDAPDAADVLRDAIRAGTGYVAMLASRGRTERTLAELRAEGFSDADLERVHLPAGLNIGGRRPGEIALSVLAEVVATWNQRPGGPMRAPVPGHQGGGSR